MKTKKYAGMQFRWESGGKSLEIENKYRIRPFCKIIFESDKIIREPEKIVEMLLGVMFGKVPAVPLEKYVIPKKNYAVEYLPKDKVIEEIKQDEEKAPFFGDNVCKVCGKVCKSKAGLAAHSRKHKKENKDGNKKK